MSIPPKTTTPPTNPESSPEEDDNSLVEEELVHVVTSSSSHNKAAAVGFGIAILGLYISMVFYQSGITYQSAITSIINKFNINPPFLEHQQQVPVELFAVTGTSSPPTSTTTLIFCTSL